MSVTPASIQDIFHLFYPEFLKNSCPDIRKQKTAWAIMNCKTKTLGANQAVCKSCGYTVTHYNSCRNRHCPMCQEIKRELWIDGKQEDILEVPYFHVVFTLPSDLNPLIYRNQKALYHLMFESAAGTLRELLGDRKYLGGQAGFLCVLHTWGQELNYHPHIHCIVMGCALGAHGNCIVGKADYLLPVRVLSRKFRGKFMDGLKKCQSSRNLTVPSHREFSELLEQCYGKEWVPYIKEGFHNAAAVLEYLGRYTHRVAISNRRIVGTEDGNVIFRAKDYQNGGVQKTVTLKGTEFVRRFLMHTLPKGFQKIRGYGLMSSRCRKNLELCRKQLGCLQRKSRLKGCPMAEVIVLLYGIDINRCPKCASKEWVCRAQNKRQSRGHP